MIFTPQLLTLFAMSFFSFLYSWAQSPPPSGVHSIYDFQMNAIDGKPISLSAYKGKKILIVNTASNCGYTVQYADLENLHRHYGDRVVVLGFPANDFLGQEPGKNEEIAAFCQKNYGVTFQMFEKITVKGKQTHPLYIWLKEKTRESPNWNFSKYLISEDGMHVDFFKSGVKPLDEQIIKKIMQ